uniref:FERM domain-containing protein 6-like isoform X2 n=1 Tax=Solea senegalensis TaxID=28829 RepID=UPI001CD8F593|nr:FERM domain-containing protein 6-like isoform X2 [Solea senegalensis]
MRTRKVCVLLPDKQHLDSTVGVKARGHEVLSIVLRQLGVCDLHVFGLAVLRDNEYLFLDLDQKLSEYFGKTWSRGTTTVPFIAFLRVQYYVEHGQLVFSSKVLQLYYNELREKVLRSQSRHQEALFFQLAASALQADVGDQELIKRRGRDYLLLHCPVLHDELRGLSRSQAVLRFIKEANSLQDGPLTFYRMRQEKREQRSSILLGVAENGVYIYKEVEGKLCLLYDFPWTDIDRVTFQGGRFEVAVVGSLCLPKLVYHTHSAFHSKHILKHLRDSHRFHINTREAASYFQQLEDMQASHLYKETYICDMARLRQRLQSCSLTSSMSDCSVAVGTSTSWFKEEEEEEEEEEDDGGEGSVTDFEMCSDEAEEFFVDDPDEVSWLAELVYGVSVDGPLVTSSSWTTVTMEMKQVLRRADEEVSVD